MIKKIFIEHISLRWTNGLSQAQFRPIKFDLIMRLLFDHRWCKYSDLYVLRMLRNSRGGKFDFTILTRPIGNSGRSPRDMGKKVNSVRSWDSQLLSVSDGRILSFPPIEKGIPEAMIFGFTIRHERWGLVSEAKNLGNGSDTDKDEIKPFMFSQ